MSASGALFDLEKLNNISKNFISTLKAEEVYDRVFKWSLKYDNKFNQLLTKYKDYSISLFNIERNQKKPRKDYINYSNVLNQIWYMYDELFTNLNYEFAKINDLEEIKNILKLYIDKYYNESDSQEEWFNKMKLLCDELGYASNMKDYKLNPDNYKGNVADISTVIRVALTTKTMTPDLYQIMKLLGKDRIESRINIILNK